MHVRKGEVYSAVIASTSTEHHIIFTKDELEIAALTAIGRNIWLDDTLLDAESNRIIEAIFDGEEVRVYLYFEDDKLLSLCKGGNLVGTIAKCSARKIDSDGERSWPTGLFFDGVILVSKRDIAKSDIILPSSKEAFSYHIPLNGHLMPPPKLVEFEPDLSTRVKAYLKGGRVVERFCLDHAAWVSGPGHENCTFLNLSRQGGYYSSFLQAAVSKTPSANMMYNLLETLCNGEKLSQYTINKRTGLAADTSDNYLQYMAEKGLIQLTTKPHRGVVKETKEVVITEKGRKVFVQLKEPFADMYNKQ